MGGERHAQFFLSHLGSTELSWQIQEMHRVETRNAFNRRSTSRNEDPTKIWSTAFKGLCNTLLIPIGEISLCSPPLQGGQRSGVAPEACCRSYWLIHVLLTRTRERGGRCHVLGHMASLSPCAVNLGTLGGGAGNLWSRYSEILELLFSKKQFQSLA